MLNIDIILSICLMLFLICIITLIGIGFDYLKFIKNYCNIQEDKAGLYDFIHIKDNIININHIINIKQVKSVKDENYKIIIELDDNKEPIFFDFDDDWRECNNVFEQIQTTLDSANIIAD